MDAVKALSYLGEFGLFQAYNFLLCALPCIVCGIYMLSNVYIMGPASHRCFIDGCDVEVDPEFNESWISHAIPEVDGFLSQCSSFNHSQALELSNSTCAASNFSRSKIVKCERWVFDKSIYKTTAISEWDLVCDDSWLVPLTQSVFMCGVLFGALICGTLADRFGRRKIFYWAPLIAVVGATTSAFAPNLLVYASASAITSACTAGMYMTAYVMASEAVGPSLRTWCGNLQQIIFAGGELLLALLAFYIRDWRRLEFALMLPMTLLLILPWLLPESVLWQNANGQSHQAMKTIKWGARLNKVRFPVDEFLIENSPNPSLKKTSEPKASILDLFRHPTLRRWSLNLFFNWIVNSLVYYGLSLEAGTISSDPYFGLALLAGVEIPSIVIGTIAMQRFGRKIVLISFMVIGGLACLSPLVIPAGHPMTIVYMAVAGKATISATFALIYVYSVEIYPTVIRSTGLGVCSMFSRLGGILAPYLSVLRRYGEFAPLYTCGALALLAGLLALDLPETHKRTLPQTIDDVDSLKYKRDRYEQFGNKRSLLLVYNDRDERSPLLSSGTS